MNTVPLQKAQKRAKAHIRTNSSRTLHYYVVEQKMLDSFAVLHFGADHSPQTPKVSIHCGPSRISLVNSPWDERWYIFLSWRSLFQHHPKPRSCGHSNQTNWTAIWRSGWSQKGWQGTDPRYFCFDAQVHRKNPVAVFIVFGSPWKQLIPGDIGM